jgi:hypothetical protein
VVIWFSKCLKGLLIVQPFFSHIEVENQERLLVLNGKFFWPLFNGFVLISEQLVCYSLAALWLDSARWFLLEYWVQGKVPIKTQRVLGP